ncbi:DUF4262 domain-containing protein [Deinococcus radiotolerans]|uniref:DUF4262 domain-containing protein n=1 Tax=Deinococcus radiotolerans TaxID=1309407 RepID=A0ABQ2FQ65_9DEIO|nr:DUF4262 domain-containing protein [Deinococcus radiotolerans]GGL16124.1 hypothetical protein GCM10010844_38740 [Deinococcus radiotolerans]
MTSSLSAPETDFDSSVLHHIKQRGWSVLTIPEDAEGPGFAFTVGLWANCQHPELILIGQPTAAMQAGLSAASQAIHDRQQRYSAGYTTPDLLAGHLCQFIPVPPASYRDYLGYALRLYGNEEFPVLQCVWSDHQGRFPWQPGASDALREQQPTLGSVQQSTAH